ncbi:MAG: hypothetical protein JO253_04620 [Alphaproteobacteria bacterium]|nr:hypothetical protein [Alphaproteobacteria bacterium]
MDSKKPRYSRITCRSLASQKVIEKIAKFLAESPKSMAEISDHLEVDRRAAAAYIEYMRNLPTTSEQHVSVKGKRANWSARSSPLYGLGAEPGNDEEAAEYQLVTKSASTKQTIKSTSSNPVAYRDPLVAAFFGA